VENLALSPEDLEKRLQSLLDTCTYTVYNYTRRGLFDRDKLIVLTLLTFTILLRSQVCKSCLTSVFPKPELFAFRIPMTAMCDFFNGWSC
jgi:hypothetical protein